MATFYIKERAFIQSVLAYVLGEGQYITIIQV